MLHPFGRVIERVIPHIPLPFLNAPFEVLSAFVTFMVGVASLIFPGENALYEVQGPILVAWAVCMALGGPLALSGLFWRGNEGIGVAVLRSGLVLMATGWGVRAIVIALMFSEPTALIAVVIYTAISLAFLLRVLALGRAQVIVRRVTKGG